MQKKRNHAELEKRIKALEKEVAEHKRLSGRLTLLSSAVDQSSEGIALVDLNGLLEYVNEAFARMHGYSSHELTGENLSVLHTLEQMPEVDAANRQVKERGEFLGEIWHVRRDGTVFPTLMHNSLLRDETGQPNGMIGTARDIAEWKTMEKNLRQENGYLSSLHETVVGLMSRLELNDLLETISVRAGSLMGTPHAFVYLVDPGTHELLMRVGLGVYERIVGFRLKAGEGLSGKVLKTGKPLIVDDYRTWPGRSKDRAFDNIRSIIGVPLKTGSQTLGVIGLSLINSERRFGEAEIAQLSRFAELASIAIDNAVLYSNLEKELVERSRIEKVLRESEARYRSVFENSSAAMMIIEGDKTISMVNTGFEKLSGYPRSEIEGKKKWTEFVVEKDLKKMKSYHEERRKTKWKAPSEYEFSFIDKKGVIKNLLLKIGMIPGTLRSVASLLDISKRKKTEESLKREKEKFRVLVEKAPLGVSLIGKDGRYKYVNSKFVEFFGYGLEDISTGKDWFSKVFPDPDFRKKAIAFWKCDHDKAKVGEVRPRIMDVMCHDGFQKTVSFRSVSMQDGDQLIIYEDITKSKQMEAQLLQAQKMEAIGTLAGGIAHDFNNLLQAILGYTQMLIMEKEREDKEYHRLGQIEKAARRASELTLQLLTFSRKVESHLRPVDLNQEIRQVEKLLKRTLPKMIDIELFLQDDLRVINADPSQIEQILMNLAVNARDAMPEGGKLIIETENVVLEEEYCRIHLGARPGSFSLLTVSDTGCGMDSKTVEHIFEPFYTTKEMGRGTGLGLSMAYGIIKSHGGYIMCYSEPGVGTTFKIYMPCEGTMNNEEPERVQEAPMPEGGTETILLVDDEEPLRELGELMLKKFGYRVLTAPDGESALEIYRQKGETISLVILDIIMPGMGGRRCLEELLRIDPDVRVVVSSGYSVNGAAGETLDAGGRGFISKPYEIRQMLKVVRKALNTE